jgi:hypothetical protein
MSGVNISQLAQQMEGLENQLETIANGIGLKDIPVAGQIISKDMTIADLFKVSQISAKVPQKIDCLQLAPDKIDQIISKNISRLGNKMAS